MAETARSRFCARTQTCPSSPFCEDDNNNEDEDEEDDDYDGIPL